MHFERAHHVAHLAYVIGVRMRCNGEIDLFHAVALQQINSRLAAITRINQYCFTSRQLNQFRIALANVEKANDKLARNRPGHWFLRLSAKVSEYRKRPDYQQYDENGL